MDQKANAELIYSNIFSIKAENLSRAEIIALLDNELSRIAEEERQVGRR